MFAARHFGAWFWHARYWAATGSTVPPTWFGRLDISDIEPTLAVSDLEPVLLVSTVEGS